MRALVILCLLTAPLFGVAWASPSEVIFPPQKMPLKFSHARHLKHQIECDFCHEQAPSSRTGSDDLIPKEEVCATCHQIDHEGKNPKAMSCASCHILGEGAIANSPVPTSEPPVAPVEMPPPNLHFDHQAHVERQVACTRCHDMKNVDLAGRAQLPQMSLCLSCHNSLRGKLDAPSRCSTCHLVEPDGKLQQHFPSGTLTPSGNLRGDAHTLEFRTNHAAVARDDERYCENCHRKDFCLSCHNGIVKPLDIHGNDYVSRHAIDARRNTPDCSSCHRAQTFCLGCHQRLGVTDLATASSSTAFQPLGTKRFHPDGWADPSAAHQPNHHAWQAQRNIKSCISCHREETCLECHGAKSGIGALGKMQVNPHPVGFARSPRCQSLKDKNERVCIRCHAPTDTHLKCQ